MVSECGRICKFVRIKKKNMQPNIAVRTATLIDLPFIHALLPSYAEFGLPSWRDVDVMVRTDSEVLASALQNGAAIFIAEDQMHTPLGFVHLHPGSDHYFKGNQCHISDLIVAPEGRGQGVGKVLMAKAEAWAKSEGYERLTLNVFAGNERARKLYEELGFGADVVKYVKEV